jgi:glucose/arabinose dehydrogenase
MTLLGGQITFIMSSQVDQVQETMTMQRKMIGLFLGLSVVLIVAAPSATWALNSVRVASGLSRPVFVTAPPGDTARVFIIEQRSGSTGRIRILRQGVLLARPFLSVANVSTGGEQGLLGLAFHPDYASNGRFYINYTNAAGHTKIVRYQVSSTDADSANPASADTVMTISQPYSNHNGGMLALGPDGYLYIGMGDGGSGGNPENRAQSDTTLLGKMLRIDVNVPSGYAVPPDNPFVGLPPRDEIWAKGMRNPWRFSFDRLTGDLYIGDVGQNLWEEVDYQPASSQGGENYGWRIMEGNHCYNPPNNCDTTGLRRAVHEYGHGLGCSISGGYVYRGCAIPSLRGTYFFADYCTNHIWSFRYNGSDTSEFQERTNDLAPGGGLSIGSISSFGEDADGELYITDLSGGEVFKIVPDSLTDCNHNGISDGCDIAHGASPDVNSNGIPDECECANDVVGNLVSNGSANDVVLHWTRNGNGMETYRVYRSQIPDDTFPSANWLLIASGLPSVSGPNAMAYSDANVIDANEKYFYLVTSVCP